jgi:hypothetical protein
MTRIEPGGFTAKFAKDAKKKDGGAVAQATTTRLGR